MKQLILLRHGETDWNSSGRWQGHSETHLNATGKKQVELAVKKIASEKIEVIYSSDLLRTKETTAIVERAYPFAKVVFTPDLREALFGRWEGLTFEEMRRKNPGIFRRWIKAQADAAPPGGETFFQLQKRVWNVVEKAMRLSVKGSILFVTHGGPVRAVFAKVVGMSLNRFWQIEADNASIWIFGVDDRKRMFLRKANM